MQGLHSLPQALVHGVAPMSYLKCNVKVHGVAAILYAMAFTQIFLNLLMSRSNFTNVVKRLVVLLCFAIGFSEKKERKKVGNYQRFCMYNYEDSCSSFCSLFLLLGLQKRKKKKKRIVVCIIMKTAAQVFVLFFFFLAFSFLAKKM